MILTIIIFIIILGVLVLAHEGGHFLVAKRTGMKVEEFGFGFPPRLIGIKKIGGKWKIIGARHQSAPGSSASQGEQAADDSTIYSINWIPFGGFVRITGENNEDADDPRSFINRPAWARFLTLIAGVSMNWILAAALFALTFMVGVTSEVDLSNPAFKNARVSNPQVAIGEVVKGQPADSAGVMSGDIILSIDGQTFNELSQVQKYINGNKGKEFQFTVKRIDKIENLSVKSLANPGPDQGPTGISLANIGKVRLPIAQSIGLGVGKAANLTVVIVQGIYSIFTSKEALSQVGGPVKIAQLTGEVATLGLASLLNFTGLLSINLAILNVLPFPALDGGRILFLAIEKVRRKRNNQKIEQYANAAGFLLLLTLMLVVTAKDIGLGKLIGRLFGG
jgi:regulator of sigma E protease